MSMFSFQPSAKNDICMLDAPQATEQQQNTNMSTAHGITVNDLRDYNRFSKLFVGKRKLGEDGDGAVYEYGHIASNAFVAIKKPYETKPTPSSQLVDEIEIEILLALGQHPHIAGMITYSLSP